MCRRWLFLVSTVRTYRTSSSTLCRKSGWHGDTVVSQIPRLFLFQHRAVLGCSSIDQIIASRNWRNSSGRRIFEVSFIAWQHQQEKTIRRRVVFFRKIVSSSDGVICEPHDEGSAKGVVERCENDDDDYHQTGSFQ